MECSPAPQLRLRRTLFWPCWVPFVTVLVVYKHWVNADFRKITLKCVAKEPRAAWYFNSSNYHLKFQFVRVRSVSFCVFVGRLFSIFVLKWSPFRCCVSRCWLQSVTWRWTVWTVSRVSREQRAGVWAGRVNITWLPHAGASVDQCSVWAHTKNQFGEWRPELGWAELGWCWAGLGAITQIVGAVAANYWALSAAQHQHQHSSSPRPSWHITAAAAPHTFIFRLQDRAREIL